MKADDKFVKAFEKEIELKSCKYKNKICDTIYFGGGTPSTLSSTQVESIMKNCFSISIYQKCRNYNGIKSM